MKGMKLKSFLSVFVFFVLIAAKAQAEPAVILLGSNIFSSVSVGSGVTQTNTFTGIDLHDSANMLVLAIPGESAEVISASFGGTPMTLTKSYAPNLNNVRFFTHSNPNTATEQTLTLVANNPTIYLGGYSPQLYAFSNVDGIGDTPEAGSGSAATVTLDFGTVTNNAYLLIMASANGTTANLSFEAPAIDLTGPINGNGGWEGRTAGESISADAGIKTVGVTSAQRVAAIGLELLPGASVPVDSGTFFYTK